MTDTQKEFRFTGAILSEKRKSGKDFGYTINHCDLAEIRKSDYVCYSIQTTTTLPADPAVWMHDYPDIDFLQRWVTAVDIVPFNEAVMMLLHERNVHKSLTARPTRLRCAWTLRGRPIVVAEQREAVRFANQGTIADMLYEAIVRDLSRFHDSLIGITETGLLYEVDEQDIDALGREIRHAMTTSAISLLRKRGISASVSAKVVAK